MATLTIRYGPRERFAISFRVEHGGGGVVGVDHDHGSHPDFRRAQPRERCEENSELLDAIATLLDAYDPLAGNEVLELVDGVHSA